MGRAKIDYPKEYRVLKSQNEEYDARYNKLLNEFNTWKIDHYKMVEKSKANVELLYEQRGIIGFLESKIVKLNELLEKK